VRKDGQSLHFGNVWDDVSIEIEEDYFVRLCASALIIDDRCFTLRSACEG